MSQIGALLCCHVINAPFHLKGYFLEMDFAWASTLDEFDVDDCEEDDVFADVKPFVFTACTTKPVASSPPTGPVSGKKTIYVLGENGPLRSVIREKAPENGLEHSTPPRKQQELTMQLNARSVAIKQK
ncbi:Uncharacterized protein Rs2_00466 [Raphanus sativus]|nr:Uncharacterized protein Rs2_00466 [Raphanus sativus]